MLLSNSCVRQSADSNTCGASRGDERVPTFAAQKVPTLRDAGTVSENFFHFSIHRFLRLPIHLPDYGPRKFFMATAQLQLPDPNPLRIPNFRIPSFDVCRMLNASVGLLVKTVVRYIGGWRRLAELSLGSVESRAVEYAIMYPTDRGERGSETRARMARMTRL
jgi:hypothetical protein